MFEFRKELLEFYSQKYQSNISGVSIKSSNLLNIFLYFQIYKICSIADFASKLPTFVRKLNLWAIFIEQRNKLFQEFQEK